MIALADVRDAIAKALEDIGLNVSKGGDVQPGAAVIGAFEVGYHVNIGGTSVAIAGFDVRVVTDRADEGDATGRLDDAQSVVWEVIETAPGPWHSLRVQRSIPGPPITLGNATYQSVFFTVEAYV